MDLMYVPAFNQYACDSWEETGDCCSYLKWRSSMHVYKQQHVQLPCDQGLWQSAAASSARRHALHLLDDRAFSSCVAACFVLHGQWQPWQIHEGWHVYARAWTLRQRFCHGMTARARPAVIGQCACCEHNLYSMTVYVHASAFVAAVCTYIACSVSVVQCFELKFLLRWDLVAQKVAQFGP